MDPRTLTMQVAHEYLKDHAGSLGPLAEKLKGYLRARDIPRLATCMSLLSGIEYRDIALERSLRQFEAFFKKNSSFVDDNKCRAAAESSFMEAERICEDTNSRLEIWYLEHSCDFESEMARVGFFISKTLGDFSHFLRDFPQRVRLTSGATSTTGRRQSQPVKKISYRPPCTPSAKPILDALYNHFGYRKPKCKVTYANRVEFVPKNWKTHRTIACEPSGNLPLQLAFDDYVKDRLRLVGIDLSNQSRNQELARVGSITGEFATIDLSSASDTLAFNVVPLLFPEDWASFLMRVRSPAYILDGKQRLYEKFSSMGNGSTFAVETLLFAAACFAVGSKTLCVYGDDIIIETHLVEKLIALLAFLGFTVNTDKSFTSGPFRESCGTHWYDGIDVTPVYIRDVNERKPVLCHLVNSLASIAGEHLASFLRDLVEEYKLPMIPFCEDTMSGVHIHVHKAYSCGLIKRRRGSPQVKAYVAKSTSKTDSSIRGLTLWYLRANFHVGRRNRAPVQASGYTTDSHKYVRSWVYWFPPVAATPVHLYWWTDYLTRES
jgi:hypothetical protein